MAYWAAYGYFEAIGIERIINSDDRSSGFNQPSRLQKHMSNPTDEADQILL
jgi:hypothetical protein